MLAQKLRKNKLVNNFLNLSVLNVSSVLLSLVTYPYLIRVLGVEIMGLVTFAQTVMQYFIVGINFGFNISSTQEIALNLNNEEALSKVVSTTLFLKFVFFLVAIVILLILILTIPVFANNNYLFFFSMILCLNEVLFPTWYFLGTEQMKFITFLNLLSKIIFTILIFVFVVNESDYLLVPLIYGGGGLIAGIISLIILFKRPNLKFDLPSNLELKNTFKNSSFFFVSNISKIVYTNSGKLLLGFTNNMEEVAYYDYGQKILDIFKNLLSTLEQAIFPRLTRTKDGKLFSRLLNISLAGVVIIVILIFLTSEYLTVLIAGKEMLIAHNILKILILSSIPIVFKVFYGHILLLISGEKGLFLRLNLIFLISYCFLLSLCFVFYEINALSISMIYLMNEILIATVSFLISKNRNNVFT